MPIIQAATHEMENDLQDSETHSADEEDSEYDTLVPTSLDEASLKYFGLTKKHPGPRPDDESASEWIRQNLFPDLKRIKDRPDGITRKALPQSTADFVEINFG